jgi:hypothetical protein
MKRPLIGVKDFHNFHWTKRISSRRGYGKLGESVVHGIKRCVNKRAWKEVMCNK